MRQNNNCPICKKRFEKIEQSSRWFAICNHDAAFKLVNALNKPVEQALHDLEMSKVHDDNAEDSDDC